MKKLEDFYKLERQRRERFKRTYCLHPSAPNGCSRNFGAAHTVQRALIERHLAEDQHVVGFHFEVNPKINAGLVKPQPIGINKASTFFGFCGTHDNDLFRPLETKAFTFTPEQIALLGFRAFSMERYNKEAELDVHAMVKDRMLERPEVQADEKFMALIHRQMGLLNARRNLVTIWEKFGAMVTGGQISNLQYFAIRFDSPPLYFASCGFLPEWDFTGKLLQDVNRLTAFSPIAFSAWADQDCGIAVYCWDHSDDNICLPFLASLRQVEASRTSNRVLSMAFEVSSNVIFRRSWWEMMKPRDQILLARRVSSGFARERTAKCLIDDGLTALGQRVLEIVTNVPSLRG